MNFFLFNHGTGKIETTFGILEYNQVIILSFQSERFIGLIQIKESQSS